MESLTKNRQSEAVLRQMVKHFFADDGIASCLELTEGYFNVAYDITLKSGKQTILKIAPPKEVRLMSYEKNLMASEVGAMKTAAARPGIPVPEIYGYDESCIICPSPYFFMEKLAGTSLRSVSGTLTVEEYRALKFQAGEINRKINEINCPRFGFPGQPDYQGEEWYPTFLRMMELGVSDARAGKVDLKISAEKLFDCLERDRFVFDEVRRPRLVHWDSWDGNIFVKDGRVVGFIDWERCLWADPLMEVGFRTYEQNEDFQRGYGLGELSACQKRRALWYDVYLLLLIALEYEYRKYETTDMYDWSTGLLVRQFEKVLTPVES